MRIRVLPLDRNFRRSFMTKIKRAGFGFLIIATTAVILSTYRHQILPAGHSQKPGIAFIASRGPAASEIIPNSVIDKQALTLDNVTGTSDREMLSILANMTQEQRRVLAKGLTKTSGNLIKIAGFFKAWAKEDSYAAFEAAKEFKTVSQKEIAFRSIFNGVEPEDAARLIDLLRTMEPGTITPEVAQELAAKGLGKWSQVDPKGAADFLSNYGDGNAFDQHTYVEVAKSWAHANPVAALEWRDKQSSQNRQMITMGIFDGWVNEDPAAAVQYARAHINDGEKGIDGISQASFIANFLAANDPAGAKEFVESLSGSAQDVAAVNAAMRIAHDDPAGAASWVSGLPTEARSDAVGAVATQYAPQDPAGARAWIATLPSDLQNNALGAYAVNARDRADGMLAALSISNETQRMEVVTGLAGQWKATDRNAFTRWLGQSGLPLETQKALMSPGG